jgi:hypothetical protein
VTEHLALELVSAAKVQVALGEKLPEALPLAKVTAPPGLDLVPLSVSVTVAVQLVPWLIATAEGVQLTAVEVVRFVTARAKPVLSALAAWIESLAL